MPKKINPDIFPFNETQLTLFRRELDEAGSFDKLMIKKEALDSLGEVIYLPMFDDIETYRKKFLSGEYDSLQDFYDVEAPYHFWSLFLEKLLEWENN